MWVFKKRQEQIKYLKLNQTQIPLYPRCMIYRKVPNFKFDWVSSTLTKSYLEEALREENLTEGKEGCCLSSLSSPLTGLEITTPFCFFILLIRFCGNGIGSIKPPYITIGMEWMSILFLLLCAQSVSYYYSNKPRMQME